jgi:putative phage-type endonuclease
MSSAKSPWNRTRGISAARLHEKKNLSDADWLAARRSGIGGSDIAAIAGVNPFSTNVDVYLDKTGQSEIPENEKMKWGKILEGPVAAEYATQNKDISVENVFAILQSPDAPFALCNLDRISINHTKSANKDSKFAKCKGNGVLEVKTTSWAQSWADAIPDYHFCQLQWYLGITGLSWGEFAVLISGNDYLESGIVDFQPDVFQNLLKIADRFWQNHVLKKTPPLPNRKPQTEAAHKLLFPNVDETTCALPDSLNPLIQKKIELSGYLKTCQSQIAEINNNILFRLGTHKFGTTSEYKVTMVRKSQRYFQEKKFKEAHPDLHHEFSDPKDIRYPLFKLLKKE